MRRYSGLLAALVLAGAAGAAWHPVAAQVSQNQLIYGQNSGTVRPVAVDATGKILIGATGDPCLDPNVAKSTVVVNISSATTTQLVALSGSTIVYVCGLSATIAGTTPTLLMEYGTGASCGTGTTALTGTFAPTAGTLMSLAVDGTEMKSIAGNAICLVSGGTPSIQGVLTYIQQ